ncbi:sucrose-6-phosphate hydrolase [Staphylococcus aureus]|nr:sucrose-6-phosphate hydrolase [Staphylococcus aureus]
MFHINGSPLGAVHGLKYWYNYTSDDLINFKAEGPILNPDTKYDSHGVYSGSALNITGIYIICTQEIIEIIIGNAMRVR